MGAADKITVVLETVGLNATELSTFCRERGSFPDRVNRWRQTNQDANATSLLTMAEQRDLEKHRAQDQKEIKRLQKVLHHKDKALADAAALLLAAKKSSPFGVRTGTIDVAG